MDLDLDLDLSPAQRLDPFGHGFGFGLQFIWIHNTVARLTSDQASHFNAHLNGDAAKKTQLFLYTALLTDFGPESNHL